MNVEYINVYIYIYVYIHTYSTRYMYIYICIIYIYVYTLYMYIYIYISIGMIYKYMYIIEYYMVRYTSVLQDIPSSTQQCSGWSSAKPLFPGTSSAPGFRPPPRRLTWRATRGRHSSRWCPARSTWPVYCCFLFGKWTQFLGKSWSCWSCWCGEVKHQNDSRCTTWTPSTGGFLDLQPTTSPYRPKIH